MSQELVLNSAHWSDTGEPVRDVIQLEGPGGMTVNVEASGEPPMVLGRCCRNAGEDFNADTYLDAAEMERRRGQLRADLGLDTEENPERARQDAQARWTRAYCRSQERPSAVFTGDTEIPAVRSCCLRLVVVNAEDRAHAPLVPAGLNNALVPLERRHWSDRGRRIGFGVPARSGRRWSSGF